MRKVLFAFAGGLAMGITSAPLEAWYLAWVALIPLWLIVIDSPSPTKIKPHSGIWGRLTSFGDRHKLTLFCAVAWGLGYQGLTLFWITGVHPMTWMGVPWFWSLCIAAICWLIITFWGIGIPFLWTVGMLLFQDFVKLKTPKIFDRFRRLFFGTALWCVIEYCWSRGDLFWHFLAFSQSPHNLLILQLTRLSGFTAVTFILVAFNAGLAEEINLFFQHKKSTTIALFVSFSFAIFSISHLWGWHSFHQTVLQTDRLAKVGVIQGNIPNEIKLYENGTSRAITNYAAGYRELAQQNVDLIVTPETAIPFRIEHVLASTDLARAIKQEKIPVIVGAFASEGDKDFTNSLLTVDGDRRVLGRYNKQQLVPLGEYIPFESIIGDFINRLSPLDTRLVRGQNPPTLLTPIGKAIAAICYESAYPDHFRKQTAAGGEFIIVSSNDAHYSPTMPAQHQALDVMHAIANDRWTVRASNTGLSSIINPNGQEIWTSQLNEFVTYAANISLKQNKTTYVQFGNWLIPFCVLIMLTIAFLPLWK